MKALIIDKPGLQSRRQRLVFGSLTTLFWALWIYLWLPVLALVGWAMGIKIAYYQMVMRNGYAGLLQELGFYGTVVACLGGALLLWAYYNYFRFRGASRRTRIRSVETGDLAEHYGISAETLREWSVARNLLIRHDVDGRIIDARPSIPESSE